MIDGFEFKSYMCSFLNVLALSKILKKYDKVRFGLEINILILGFFFWFA